MIIYFNHNSKMFALHVSTIRHFRVLKYIKRRLCILKYIIYMMVGMYGSILINIILNAKVVVNKINKSMEILNT